MQNQKIDNSFKLTRVGISGLKKPVSVKRPDGRVITVPIVVNVAVDLPSVQKGSHLSRNVEVINEIVDKTVREPVAGLEDLVAAIALTLLDKHEYAMYSEVNLTAEYFLERKLPSGAVSLEPYALQASAQGHREQGVRKCLGVEVTGINACPCAMESIRAEFKAQCDDDALEKFPVITHNQRNISTLELEIPDGVTVEADELIELVESSLSSPSFAILKRNDEARVVINAHENPNFVEDVVRGILQRVLERFKEFPDPTRIKVTSRSEESIHKHDAFAERVTTFGELRA